MKIIVTMAGEGSRFKKEGYDLPKYEIPVKGKPVMEWVLNSYKNFFDEEFVFIGKEGTGFQEFVTNVTGRIGIEKIDFFEISKTTDGQASTVMEYMKTQEVDEEILIINIDTAFKSRLLNKSEIIKNNYWWLTADMEGDHWSFVKFDKENNMIATSEKVRISNYASAGLYFFKSSNEFKSLYDQNYAEVISQYGETYIAPFFNYVEKQSFGYKHITKKYIYPFGTPKELEKTTEYINDIEKYEELSIVASQYNGWNYVENIINRYKTTCKDISSSLIIVNNGSNEKIPTKIKAMLEDDIEIINKDYGNIGTGRQVAIHNGLGDYVTILDIDDDFVDDFFVEMLNSIKEPGIDMVFGVKQDYNFLENVKTGKTYKYGNHGDTLPPRKLKSMIPYPHNKLFKREQLINIEPSFIANYDNKALIPIVTCRAKKIKINNKAIYLWRHELENSASRGLMKAKQFFDIHNALEKAIKQLDGSEDMIAFKKWVTREMVRIIHNDPRWYKFFRKETQLFKYFKISLFKSGDWEPAYATYISVLAKWKLLWINHIFVKRPLV